MYISLRRRFADAVDTFIREKRAADGLGTEPTMLPGLKAIKEPERADLGHLAVACFAVAKAVAEKPEEAARRTAAFLTTHPAVAPFTASAEVAGPYVNVRLSPAALGALVLHDGFAGAVDRAAPDRFAAAFGDAAADAGPIVVDFSSPNIAKPIAFHHIRSTVIGHSLCRMYEAQGYKVVRINYLGDWGTTQGKLIVAWRRFGDDAALARDGVRHLLDIYVRFTKESEHDSGLEAEARAAFAATERGDAEALGVWRRFRDVSLAEFARVYERLGVRFDGYGEEGESRYRDVLDDTVTYVKSRVPVELDEGCELVRVTGKGGKKLPPVLLRKTDGATLYATRDVAAARDRFARFGFSRAVYVVGGAQGTYFDQLFALFEAMGEPYAGRATHAGFGTLLMRDPESGELSKGSTRSGNLIFLEDVLNRVAEASAAVARENADEQGLDPAEIDALARAVGNGAVMFNDLYNHRTKDVVFDWDQALRMNGETGPYVQYAHARIRSMLRRAPETSAAPDPALITTDEEAALLMELEGYPDTVRRAGTEDDPSLVARRLIAITRAFSALYARKGDPADPGAGTWRFLAADAAVRATRLALARATAAIVAHGLYLLGIEAPERM